MKSYIVPEMWKYIQEAEKREKVMPLRQRPSHRNNADSDGDGGSCGKPNAPCAFFDWVVLGEPCDTG